MNTMNAQVGKDVKHISDEFKEEMKQRLLKQKQKLEEDLKGIAKHTELGNDLDSQVQEIEDDEVSQDVIAAMRADLEKISKALEKTANGTYGLDDEGREISEARLRVLPWADKAI